MRSLRDLYRIGPGPSSSHTIGPHLAAKSFFRYVLDLKPDHFEVTFYGSLAFTGRGHCSSKAVQSALSPYPCDIILDTKTVPPHPLTMAFRAYHKETLLKEATYFSLGGGALMSKEDVSVNEREVYPFRNFEEIKIYLDSNGIKDLKDFCLRFEDENIDEYLLSVVRSMFSCVENGLSKNGKIPANSNPRLEWNRVAGDIYRSALASKDGDGKDTLLMTSFAYAVAEGNACGESIVTAPTCGASGVLPAILYFEHMYRKAPLDKIQDALYVAGVFGNLIKQNSSIAGSVGGCQAEIGTASSMAAAAMSYLEGLSLYQIEYAAECAMEHFLGLSCDPVDGYVIIPCIERNGMGACRAYDSYLYAHSIAPIRSNRVHFDDVVKAMKLTGDSLSPDYKETALGGLAKILAEKRC